ncbi:hypothetical protein IBTHAUMO2_790011 [Nitrosopumilaceae archaeon]|nr:hypothetical protein [Nitrosopumilus sp.]CAI9832469.1 hypothetical protein IBTHAUMO2_790011 [Nitrosopumilaceae archaeon]MDA7944747.1 hypothetical protein [Nitrosopumilus sp.]MDA7955096.1 hypothetical protein [Nitrosopumilus sp.]MDA7974304.1 hypothetical protein [Nitrosopumilus sp.]
MHIFSVYSSELTSDPTGTVGNYYKRIKHEVIRLHRDCIPEHVWLVHKYASQRGNFSDIETEHIVNAVKLKYNFAVNDKQEWVMLYKKQTHWSFPTDNKDLSKTLKEINEKRNLCFVCCKREGSVSPPVVYPIGHPAINHVTSSQEYAERTSNAQAEYGRDCREAEELASDKGEALFNAWERYIVKTSLVLDL